MPVYLNGLEVVHGKDYYIWQVRSKTKIATVWPRITKFFDKTVTTDQAGTLLSQALSPHQVSPINELTKALDCILAWMKSTETRRYENDAQLASAVAVEIGTASRPNYFYQQKGENENIAEVIHHSGVPLESIGWSEREFFAGLGHEDLPAESEGRHAEQEYLLQNMVKGALFEAATIAEKYKVGISVRGTGLLAHMGIESGDPTKAQEFKNKTSKEVDLFLCDELKWEDLGAVVHYDPRVGWSSAQATSLASLATPIVITPAEPSEHEWIQKRQHIESKRIPALKHLGPRIKVPASEVDWKKLKDQFMSRAKEYREEDYDYRFGHYAPYTQLVGPYVRLKLRPEVNMVGDHDLFGFTMGDTYGKLVHDSTPPLRQVQIALQQSPTFQAQHGGIWNWRPKEEFHKGIKAKIMGAHSAPDGEPLVYILPGKRVHAAFYVPGEEVLKSVWEFPEATAWLKSTYSGKKMLETV